MAEVMFIKPQLETDANWDPVRTCPYLGAWYMASGLKEAGHQVAYLDEAVRNDGLKNRELFHRELRDAEIIESPVAQTYEEFQAEKMKDYNSMSPAQFVGKYSAFKNPGVVSRTLARSGNGLEKTLEEVERFSPDVVGIPLIATVNYDASTKMARAIKAKFPRTKILFGGQHVSADPEQFLRENPYVDQVVSGDAISVIKDIVEGKVKDRIVYGGFQSMGEFPLLDPSIIEGNDYPRKPTYSYPTNGRKSVDYMLSRGCFRNCDFCVAGSQEGNHVTPVEEEGLGQQLDIFREHGIEELIVQDDAFLWDKSHVNDRLPKILKAMKDRGLYWQNNGGVEFEMMDDFVTDQLIEYNKSGEGRLTALYVPFNPRAWNKRESAASSMTQRYHKNLENLKRLREEAGVYVFTSGILGTPEQTRETISEERKMDKQLIREGYIDSALALSATMLPGTEWDKTNGHNIVNPRDYPGFSLFATHHKTPNLSPREIEEEMIRWNQDLGEVQKTYKWGTAFPNAKG